MSKRPLVSVIVPAHNAESYIDDAIQSILAQTYPDLEILVVDHGSTDGTSARIAAYAPPVRCLRVDHGVGSVSHPRNEGILRSTGEYIAFLDADDLMLPGRIQRQADFLASHPEVCLVFSDYRNFSGAGPIDRSHFQSCTRLRELLGDRPSLVLTSKEASALLLQENFGIAGSFMIRREILKCEDGFEPTLRACEDFHFYFRVARHGPVGVIDEVVMLRRLHGGNMSASQLRMLSEGIRSRGLLRDQESDPAIVRYLNSHIAECHASRARCYANDGNYLQAFRDEWKAFCYRSLGNRVWLFCLGIARIIAMATGAYRPRLDRD